MKSTIALTFTLLLLAAGAHADTHSDRAQIKAAMECFYQWDLHGGEENSSQCIADTVLYHRIDENGRHSY
ncbi:MAG: hypothetical protein AAFX85_14225, partial [Pseudomonadota bacterium]